MLRIIQGEVKGCHSLVFMKSLYADNAGMKILVKKYGGDHWDHCLRCEGVVFDCHRITVAREAYNVSRRIQHLLLTGSEAVIDRLPYRGLGFMEDC
jgi:hypothetical protein